MDKDAEGRAEAELVADAIRAHGDALGGNLVHFKRFLDALLERQSKAADATAQQHLAVNQTAARAAQAATDAARKSARAAMWSVVVAVILAALTLQAQPPVRPLPPTTIPQAAQEKPWPPPGVTRVTGDILPPRATYEVRPRYTPEAMKAGVSGAVLLEAVVDATGQVGDVRVTRSLDREFGLDDRAVAAVKQWRFAPARKDGVAVPVVVEIEMTFKQR